ncbi:hypothetical protein RB653_010027 [Dictyostelium firmibasis]|uniref:MRH domain-containing protein n=1 Tax=Dictyostelium firmibasis TaxID=79012 RepID=A0AAN7YKN2_9MYCE
MKILTIKLLIILIINFYYVNSFRIDNNKAVAEIHSCRVGEYDFSGFRKEKGSYEFKSKKLNNLGEEVDVEYYFNICSGSSKCDNSLISVCSRDSQFNDFVYGQRLNSSLSKFNNKKVEGGILTYTSTSSECASGLMKTTISMYCSKGQPNTVISVSNESPLNKCNLEIAMLGDSACEKKVDIIQVSLFVVSSLLALLIVTLITCTILYYIDKKKKLSMGYSKLAAGTTPGSDSW